MNLGAFLVVIVVHNGVGSFDIKDYAGIWRRAPLLTIIMGIFLFSLMGIPPFAGFLAKWYVFAAVINAGLGWFAVIGVHEQRHRRVLLPQDTENHVHRGLGHSGAVVAAALAAFVCGFTFRARRA